ncbi:Ribosomal rna small subunit methyltransferase h [Thalictrum thalictroides]|uniref:Ribosomal rna small subunit methyltransferase h n=1 Tax=Thalictrum thalictroides TaxID=46969 RepID=A0A7J6XGC0_THATH|nr:Ribosomal rna small subunit methyltransferase h [Thalictrum thalictroides]
MAAVEVARFFSFSRQYQWRSLFRRHALTRQPCFTALFNSDSNSNSNSIGGGVRFGGFGLSMCLSTNTSNTSNRTTSKSTSKKKKKTKIATTKQAKCNSNFEEIKRKKEKDKEKEKRRTRSEMEFDLKEQHYDYNNLFGEGHIPVLLGEVLQVFKRSNVPLRSFVDCTIGAAGHSSAIIQGHPELQLYVGLDVDPVAHEKAQTYLDSFLNRNSGGTTSDFTMHTFQKNFKDIKSILSEVDEKLLIDGVDGILMDLGVSSMQVNNGERGFSVLSDGPLDMRMDPKASLKAEDIINTWPEAEVGRILREYGEETNWRHLQNKIVKARLDGGLHSTGELVNLVQSMTPMSKGRQGWVKTATRVFQALRIAVNDELKTLEHALRACFECLSFGGRLAVISFHSLEDRIVKQTFLDIVNMSNGEGAEALSSVLRLDSYAGKEETWVKQRVSGRNGIILTKRPITPSEEEESLNYRCRSAKLRVIEKMRRQ